MTNAPAAESVSATSPRRNWRRIGRLWILAFLAVVVVWIIGDFVYSRFVLARLDRYERSMQWDEFGVRKGEDTYQSGDGKIAILCVHGINFSPVVYQKVVPALVERGTFTCRAMRLPGFAMPVREYARFRYPDWVAAVDREVQSLQADHEKVYIVAHSLGAAITLRYWLERRPKIDGLILLAPAIEVSNDRSPILPTRFWHEFSKRTLFFTQIVLSPFQYDVRDPKIIETIPQLQFTPRTIVDQTFAMLDLNRGKASEFDVPLLLIVSPTDHVIDTPAAEAYFKQWGCATKRLIRQDRAGHMVTLDFGWEDVVDHIAKFAENPSQFVTEPDDRP